MLGMSFEERRRVRMAPERHKQESIAIYMLQCVRLQVESCNDDFCFVVIS